MNRLNWLATGTTLTQVQLDWYVDYRMRHTNLGETVSGVYRPDSHYGFQAKPKFKRVGWAEENAKDGQKKPIYETIVGLCPCKVCDHTYMLECELEEEQGKYKKEKKDDPLVKHCCSEFCT